MAPKYKLMYFNFMAIAEPIRFLLHYGNIEFEDYRYSEEEWRKEIKPISPIGQGPLLEVDGDSKNRLWQSVAIQRYFAKKVGLLGEDAWETFQIDMIAETIYDLRCVLYNYYFLPEAEKTPEKKENRDSALSFYTNRLDKTVSENNGHFVNGKLTWPDLQYTAMYEYFCHLAGKDVEVGLKNLADLRSKVREIPQIKAWVEKRPYSIT